jgi:hypothetical protein
MKSIYECFIRVARAFVIVFSFGGALWSAFTLTALAWVMRDGLGPGAVESHGFQALERFVGLALSVNVISLIIALPGALLCLPKHDQGAAADTPLRRTPRPPFADLTPAVAPEGRGDEATPAGRE